MPLSSQQTTEIKQQYDPMRKRAQQQEAAHLQGQNDAIARRAASMGGGPGGAMVKQEVLAQNESAKRVQDANEGINAQEAGALHQAREVQAQRDWQSGERVASQQHATSERLGGQEHQSKLSKQGIDAQFELQKNQIAAAEREGRLTREQGQKQLDELKRQYDTDLVENKKTNTINSIISGYNSKISPEAMGSILAALGIDVGAIPGLTAPKEAAAPKPGMDQVQPGKPGTYKHYNQHTGQYYWDNNPVRAIKE